MQCPLKCSDKDFKRLELHLGMVHGKEVIDAFTNTEPSRTETVSDSKPDVNPVTPAVVNPGHLPNNPVLDLKVFYREQNEILMLQLQQKELFKALRGETQQQPSGLKDFIELQREISKQESEKIESIKKQLQESDNKDGSFEMQMLMNILGGLQQNAKPKPDTAGDIIDTEQTR